MTDTANRDWHLVITAPGTAPLMLVPLSQLQEVCARLDRASISDSVDPCAISTAGQPEITTIHFSPDLDAAWIQATLNERL